MKQLFDRSSGQMANRSIGQMLNQTIDQSVERSNRQSVEWTSGRPNKRSNRPTVSQLKIIYNSPPPDRCLAGFFIWWKAAVSLSDGNCVRSECLVVICYVYCILTKRTQIYLETCPSSIAICVRSGHLSNYYVVYCITSFRTQILPVTGRPPTAFCVRSGCLSSCCGGIQYTQMLTTSTAPHNITWIMASRWLLTHLEPH